MVASFGPLLSQVSQTSSGSIGSIVRHTWAPFSFHVPDTAIALSPAGVMVPESLPSAASTMRAVNTFPPCRSEEHTSELQSRGLISYAVFCLKKARHARGQDRRSRRRGGDLRPRLRPRRRDVLF